MGAALKRPLKNYNVANRAFKEMDKAKTNPKPAPRYPTEAAVEARNRAALAAEAALIHQRNPDLDERLKQVYVESIGTNPEIKSKRKLPQDRSTVVDPEFGYLEPVNVTKGKITLRQAVDMINNYKDNPTKNSAKVLSQQYNLDLDTVSLILEYFQPYNLRLPKAQHLVRRTHPLLKDMKLRQAQKLLEDTEKSIKDQSS